MKQMSKTYENLTETTLFGKWTDPYADRRGNSPQRPDGPIPHVEPVLNRDFELNKLSFCWLGHSSVYLQIHGCKILIDPIFASYSAPVPVPMLKRFDGYLPKASDFPEIDLVLITHNHYDHLDRKTIRMLRRQVKFFVVPEGVGRILCRFGIPKRQIKELVWEQTTSYHGLKITLLPSQHGSARFIHDRNKTLWGGYLLRDENYTVYDSGDGGFSNYFAEIPKKYGPIDLAIMECGQYNERWHGVHMFPEEMVEAVRMLNPKLTIPVHWGAYILSDHGWDDSIRRFERRAEEVGIDYRIPVQFEWVEL